jgi:transcriptional regulator with XRE-family HTH domain
MPGRSDDVVSRRDEMSRLLIAIRGRHRNQTDAAALVGLSQVRVSRLERGEGPPLNPDEAAAYAAALGATAEQTARLVELARVKTAEHSVPRAVMLRNAVTIQRRIRDYMAASDVIRSWHTDTIPGVLQTRAWAEAMRVGESDEPPPPEWWVEREAQAALLDDPARTWHILLAESALRWIVGSREIQARQIRHIAELSNRPHLRIGVVDLRSPKPLTAAYGFQVYGDRAAEVASDLGATFPEHPGDVAYLLDRHARLAELAVYDDDARALLERIARTLGR